MALMNSFYGGRRGASFVIVKNYLDIYLMTKDFEQGTSIQVNFDEYVMINNPNKNHPDNGKIFRRGYDYNSDRLISGYIVADSNFYNGEVTEDSYKNLGENGWEKRNIEAHGAEYIGTIIGPAGKAPLLTMTSYADAEARQAEDNFETRQSNGQYSPNGINPGLIPGKYEEQENNEIVTKYNDSIEWYCTSVRNDDYGDDTEAYIGFKFPYLVTQMQTSQVIPYNENGNIDDMSNIERVDDGSHPYYNKWHLNIPKGVKGDTLKNFKVTTFSNYINEDISQTHNRNLYDINDNILLGVEGSIIKDNLSFFAKKYTEIIGEILTLLDAETEEYGYVTGKDRNDLISFLSDKEIFVYEKWNYDEKQNGILKYYYLGDCNQIKEISLDKGKLTISYTNQKDTEISLLYPVSIDFSEANHELFDNPDTGRQELITDDKGLSVGQVRINYSDEETANVFQLKYVDDITYDDDTGSLSFTKAGSLMSFPLIENLKYIKNIAFSNQQGSSHNNMVIQYNLKDDDGKTIKQTFELPSIDTIEVVTTPQPGIQITYLDGSTTLLNKNHKFDFLTDFTPYINRNTNEWYGLKYSLFTDEENGSHDFKITTVHDIEYDQDNDNFKLTYSDPDIEPRFIQNLPVLKNLSIKENDLSLLIETTCRFKQLESEEDPTKDKRVLSENQQREEAPFIYRIGSLAQEDYLSILNSFSIAYISKETLANLLEGENITEDTHLSVEQIIDYLNQLYPHGYYSEDNLFYTIVAVGDIEASKAFFCYDAAISSWFYIGRITQQDNPVYIEKNGIPSSPENSIILKANSDICSVEVKDITTGNEILDYSIGKNKMTEILKGKRYINYILPLKSNERIIVSMGGENLNININSSTIASERKVEIAEVTGPIVITKESQ